MTAPIPTKATKASLIRDIIQSYTHDYEAEGGAISKRRLWYILKPKFAALPSYTIIETVKGKKQKVKYLLDMFHNNKPIKAISNADYSKYYNDLAKAGAIDDTYISDNSRVMNVGSRTPNIIIAVEKSTVDTAVLDLADRLGCSCYIAKGFSSIYAAKKLMSMIEIPEQPYQIEGEIDEEGDVYYSDYEGDTVWTPIIVLNMTDYDKSGKEISNTIADHFRADEHYRVLLNPSQIPDDKLDDYFTTDDKEVGKAYELDILNIHQLKDIFLDAIPENVADTITGKYRKDHFIRIGDSVIPQMVDKDPKVEEIQQRIDSIDEAMDDIRSPYQEQIEELENLMDNATQTLDEERKIEVMNQGSMCLEVLPKHREIFYNYSIGTYVKPISIQRLAG